MAAEPKPEIHFEIAHVLYMDVVGYSKLLINDQSEILAQLNQLVRKTSHFREADSAGKLIRLATGDGMALVFFNNVEAPVKCALEISQALQSYPHIHLRMGVHSGPINPIRDVNDRTNVTGAGINLAQRVMACGDAGHILLSRRVAEDLEQYRQWQPHLHDLGTIEVKHGVRVRIFNLYKDEVGNPKVPAKLKVAPSSADAHARIKRRQIIAAILAITALILGSGLWLIAHRSTLKSTSGAMPSTANPVPPIPEKSIAVLPFENLSEEKANEFFADGVQDEILTDLARIADLKVISRTSVRQYKSPASARRNLREIGQQLDVANVVEGSVQRSGNRVRVNAQLIDARTDKHLWGQTYDRDLADVFAIQSEIAKAIADQLQAKLSPSERTAIEQAPTSDIAAFDLYTRARDLILKSLGGSTPKNDLLQAIDLLNQAVARDPSFLRAYCELALAHDALYFNNLDHTPERLALANAAVEAASRLRPDAGETHLARAQNLYNGYLNYDGALAELEIARRTLPNSSLVLKLTGFIKRRQGKLEESIKNLERALELDPRSTYMDPLGSIASNYALLRRYPEAAAALDRTLSIKPDDVGAKLARAALELDWKADSRPLHQLIDSIRATNPEAIQDIAAAYWLLCVLAERDTGAARDALNTLGEKGFNDDVIHFNHPFAEGMIARMTKDDDKALSAFTASRIDQTKIIQAQPNFGPALCVLGLIDAGLGRKEEALREGRRAVELLPATKDALNGMTMIKYLAMIAAWVGEKDLACEQLTVALRSPSLLSYGQLKLLPVWDPLRGDPRFETLVEEAKQPVVLK